MKNIFEGTEWKHYIPAGGLFLAALIFTIFEKLAVFLVVGSLISFGFLYSLIIYRIHSVKNDPTAFARLSRLEQDVHSKGEPTFMNMMVALFKKKPRE